MREENIADFLISLVKQDSKPAMGCTEPVAIAYCAYVASREINRGEIQSIDVELSRSIFKNAKAVKIPGTGRSGIDYSTALGVGVDNVESPLLIFEKVDDDLMKQANEMLENRLIKVSIVDDVPGVYVACKIKADKEVVATVSHAHDHIEEVKVDGEVIYSHHGLKPESSSANPFEITDLTVNELIEIADTIDYDLIRFTLEGIDINMAAYEEGMKGYGLGLGKGLRAIGKGDIDTMSLEKKIRTITAAAVDMRMGGGKLPIMTSGGSGNQGIGVILTLYLVSLEENISDERLTRALFFAHCLNHYIKNYSGKLSGMCGCGIASSVSAAAGIVYMLGGNYEQIAGACANVYGNLTGLVCDGAKESCSLKLSTSSAEAMLSAYLALNNVIAEENVGVLGTTLEETIMNIGKLSTKSFVEVDEDIVDMI